MQHRPQETKLSPREAEIATLVCEGRKNYDIAFRLHISENTVKLRLQQMFLALNVQSRLELALWCLQNPQALKGEWASVHWQRKFPCSSTSPADRSAVLAS